MKPYFYIYNATIGEFTGEKFDTAARAAEVSLELAEANHGESFEILRCVGYSSTSKASTFWMDGEVPPEKPRYRMLEIGDWTAESDEYEKPRNSGNWVPVVKAPYELCQFNNRHRRPL